MSWKDWPYWLKGGVITFIIVALIEFFLIFFPLIFPNLPINFLAYFFLWTRILIPHSFEKCINSDMGCGIFFMIIFPFVISIISYFIVGVIIGWIYGKIKGYPKSDN